MADKNVILHPQGDSSTNIYPKTKQANIIDLDLSDYATKDELDDKQDVISDLSTIRTGAGLGATALQSVPNTYRTASAQDTIDAGKQATLVSGTTIKTINSTTLLGSGDIAVQPTLVSGTNIKTINGDSVLGSGNLVISGGSSYTAGNGIVIEDDEISIDEDVVALKEDLPTGEVDLTLTSTSISDGTTTLDISGKQDTLTAGTNITIVDNVISASGGGGGASIVGGYDLRVVCGESGTATPIYVLGGDIYWLGSSLYISGFGLHKFTPAELTDYTCKNAIFCFIPTTTGWTISTNNFIDSTGATISSLTANKIMFLKDNCELNDII